MGFLDGSAAALFTELLAPLYLPATVYQMTETQDTRGNPRRVIVERPCRAQVDAATQTMRIAPDFSITDRAIYILANTLEGGMAEGYEAEVHAGPYAGTRWKIADPITRDPAAAYWLCRAVLGKAVAGG